MADCVNTVVRQVAASNGPQRSTVVADLQVLAAYPGFPDALAADTQTRINPQAPLNNILVELSMLGTMKTAPGTQTLKSVVQMPLPTTGTCVRQDPGSGCDLREAQYLRHVSPRAIDGLAFLKSSDGDALVLAAVSDDSNPTLQARAVMAYLWNHGATDVSPEPCSPVCSLRTASSWRIASSRIRTCRSHRSIRR